MSIEIESEFSAVKVKGEKYLQTVFSAQPAKVVKAASAASYDSTDSAYAVCDRGISSIRAEWSDSEESYGVIHTRHPLKENDELIGFCKDPDYEDDGHGFENSGKYDSLLPYDYEAAVADFLNLDEQIAMYAADSWEFVSMTDNHILFQRPKWEA